MVSNQKNIPSEAKDLKKVTQLYEAGKLPDVIKKLDPDNVKGSLRRAPHEAIRLLLAILSNKEENEKKIESLDEAQRVPLKALITLARQNRGEAFITNFIKEASKDSSLLLKLGISLPKEMPITQHEADIFNTITNVITIPTIMLKSRRIYLDVGMYQEDKILFRSMMELDTLLKIVHELLASASGTFSMLSKNFPRIAPRVSKELCNEYLQDIRRSSIELDKALRKLPKPKD